MFIDFKFGSVTHDSVSAARMSIGEYRTAIHAMQSVDTLIRALTWLTHSIRRQHARPLLADPRSVVAARQASH